MAWLGLVACCRARRTARRILPAAHPHTELTTSIVVPGWASAASTSAAVRASFKPARVSSSRIGISMISGYMESLLGTAAGTRAANSRLYGCLRRYANAHTSPFDFERVALL